MNRRNFRFLAICAVSSFFLVSIVTSCKKSNDSSTPSGPFSATVDGKVYVPTATTAVYDHRFDDLTINGAQVKGNDSISFWVQIPVPAHAHDTITFGDDVEIWYEEWQNGTRTFREGGNYFDPTDGYVIIDSYDGTNKKISGSFQGILRQGDTDSMVVKSGHFNTTWTDQN